MDKEYIEIFKTLSPFIILAITHLLTPRIKTLYSSYISFFSLPTSKKIEAIEYINEYKKSSNTLEKLKHRMMISDYKLHEDTELSKCVISFFYEDIGKNGYFAKSLLRAKGLYVYEDKGISINVRNILVALAFWFLAIAVYALAYHFSPDLNNGMPNAILAISLIVSTVFYMGMMLILSSRFISIISNKKRFNNYLSSKL